MKNRKKKPLILAMCVVLALVTVLSSTFAWFTAQDEVKNHLQTSRLTDGDVTIIETFDPNDQLEPGVAVNKQVGAINTGDTEALVRMSFAEALQKLATGKEIRNAAKFTSSTTEIPQLVNLSAYADWMTLTSSSFPAATGSATFSALPAGITVVYKQTATAPEAKYRFAAYAALGTTPETYQRVDLAPELFNMIDGKLKITLVNPSNASERYYDFITLLLSAKTTSEWRDFTDIAGTVQTLPDSSRTFGPLSEPSTRLVPNNATPSISSAMIQLIFGDNVKTSLNGISDGDWYYNANDGWFYYMGAVASGASTGNLLEKVYMMQAADSSFSYTKFDLTVKMEAIQAVKDAVTTTSGWGLIGSNATLATKLQSYCS